MSEISRQEFKENIRALRDEYNNLAKTVYGELRTGAEQLVILEDRLGEIERRISLLDEKLNNE